MTDTINPDSKHGSKRFFDFINKRLDGVHDAFDASNAKFNDERKAKLEEISTNRTEVKSGAKNIVSIIKERMEYRKFSRKLFRLEKNEAKELKKAARRISKVGYSREDTARLIENKQKEIKGDYKEKFDKVIGCLEAHRNSKKGSVRKEVKKIGKEVAKYVLNSAKLLHINHNINLNRDCKKIKVRALNTLGVVTSPLKMTMDVAKGAYDRVVPKAKEVGNKVAEGARNLGTKAKKKGLHARWVARETAKKFKNGAKKKWVAGKEVFNSFCGKVSEGLTNTGSKLKGLGRTIAGAAKTGVKVVKAHREGMKAVRAQRRSIYNQAYSSAMGGASR